MLCPHCGSVVFRKSGDKLKARTRIVVLHKSGEVEINCAKCARGVLLPATVSADPLRKASAPRLVVRKG